MTKQTKISRLAKLTVALVTSAALMSSVEIANAKAAITIKITTRKAPRPDLIS
jgi:hypothetical protein